MINIINFIRELREELDYYLDLRSTDNNFNSFSSFSAMVRRESRSVYPINYRTDDKCKIYHQLRERKCYIREKMNWYKRFFLFTLTYDIFTGIIFSILMLIFLFLGILLG